MSLVSQNSTEDVDFGISNLINHLFFREQARARRLPGGPQWGWRSEDARRKGEFCFGIDQCRVVVLTYAIVGLSLYEYVISVSQSMYRSFDEILGS